jgi:hypothetical protein
MFALTNWSYGGPGPRSDIVHGDDGGDDVEGADGDDTLTGDEQDDDTLMGAQSRHRAEECADQLGHLVSLRH